MEIKLRGGQCVFEMRFSFIFLQPGLFSKQPRRRFSGGTTRAARGSKGRSKARQKPGVPFGSGGAGKTQRARRPLRGGAARSAASRAFRQKTRRASERKASAACVVLLWKKRCIRRCGQLRCAVCVPCSTGRQTKTLEKRAFSASAAVCACVSSSKTPNTLGPLPLMQAHFAPCSRITALI